MSKRTLVPGVIAGLASLMAAQTAPIAQVHAPAWGRHRIVWFGTGEDPVKTQLCGGGERVEFDKATYAGWKKGEPGDGLSLGDRGAMLDTFSTLKFDGGELPPGTYFTSLRRAEKGFEMLFFEAVVMLRAGEHPDRPRALGPAARAPLRKAKGGRNKSPLTWSLSSSKPREPELQVTYGKVGLALRFAIDDLEGTSPFEF